MNIVGFTGLNTIRNAFSQFSLGVRNVLTEKQKKVVVIASVIFAAAALSYYLYKQFRFKAEKRDEDKKLNDIIQESVRDNTGIKMADEQSAILVKAISAGETEVFMSVDIMPEAKGQQETETVVNQQNLEPVSISEVHKDTVEQEGSAGEEGLVEQGDTSEENNEVKGDAKQQPNDKGNSDEISLEASVRLNESPSLIEILELRTLDVEQLKKDIKGLGFEMSVIKERISQIDNQIEKVKDFDFAPYPKDNAKRRKIIHSINEEVAVLLQNKAEFEDEYNKLNSDLDQLKSQFRQWLRAQQVVSVSSSDDDLQSKSALGAESDVSNQVTVVTEREIVSEVYEPAEQSDQESSSDGDLTTVQSKNEFAAVIAQIKNVVAEKN